MNRPNETRDDRGLLFAIAGLVAAGAVGIAVVASLHEDEPATTAVAPVSRPAAPAMLASRQIEPPVAPPAEEKIPGSTVDPAVAASAEATCAASVGDQAVGEGLSAYDSREFARAADCFEIALAGGDERAWTRYMYGLSLWKDGSLDAAAEAMRQAIETDPDSVKARVNLSRIENDRGEFDAALAAATEALAVDGDDPSAWFLQGRALYNLQRTDEALPALEESLAREPGNGYVHNLVGLIHLDAGRTDLAATVLARAAELTPDVAFIHNNLGMALERTGSYAEAVAAYRDAVALGAGHEKAQANLMRLEPLAPVVVTDADPQADEPDSVTVAEALAE